MTPEYGLDDLRVKQAAVREARQGLVCELAERDKIIRLLADRFTEREIAAAARIDRGHVHRVIAGSAVRP